MPGGIDNSGVENILVRRSRKFDAVELKLGHSCLKLQKRRLQGSVGAAEGEVKLDRRLLTRTPDPTCHRSRTEGGLLEMGGLVVFLEVPEEGVDGSGCWLLEQGHPSMHMGRLRLHLTLEQPPLPLHCLERLVMFSSGLVGGFQFAAEMNPEPQSDNDKNNRDYKSKTMTGSL